MTWGGGAGHILDAINRLRHNKSLIETRKYNKLRARYREEVLKVEYKRKRRIPQNKITKEERAIIKNRIRKQETVGVIKSIIVSAVFLGCLFLFFYLAATLKNGI